MKEYKLSLLQKGTDENSLTSLFTGIKRIPLGYFDTLEEICNAIKDNLNETYEIRKLNHNTNLYSRMRLSDYMDKFSEEEISVHDKDYEMECYFYGGTPADKWDKAMLKIASELSVISVDFNISNGYCSIGVTTDLSDIIVSKLDKIRDSDLFIVPTIDAIMYDMENILAGYVSEKWIEDFANIIVE